MSLLLVSLAGPWGYGVYRSESERLKGEITDINSENDKLKRELNALKSENSRLPIRLAHLNLQISSLPTEPQNLPKGIDAFRAQWGMDKKNKNFLIKEVREKPEISLFFGGMEKNFTSKEVKLKCAS